MPEMPDRVEDARVKALRILSRGLGLSTAALLRSRISPELFGVGDEGSAVSVIVNAANRVEDFAAGAAIRAALGIAEDGKLGRQTVLLSERRYALAMAQGLSVRTVQRNEALGAVLAAKEVSQSAAANETSHPVAGTTLTGGRIAILDPHPVLAIGLQLALAERLPEYETTVAPDPEAMADQLTGLVLVIVGFPAHDLQQIADRILEPLASAGIPVLVYTADERRVPLLNALDAGVAGIVEKSSDVETVVQCVRRTLAGESPVFSSERLGNHLLNANLPMLTDRQVEILSLMAHGLPYRRISKSLGISESTVREHLQRARAAYAARSGVNGGTTLALIHQAQQDGFIIVE